MAITPRKEIQEGGKIIEDVMQDNLSKTAEDLINQIMAAHEKLPPSRIDEAIVGLSASGRNRYKSDLLATMSVIADDALRRARKEVPKAKNVKLAEWGDSVKLGEFEDLPPKIRNRLNAQAKLLIDTQLADIEKAVFFQYNSSSISTDSAALIKDDLANAATDHITGNSIRAGSRIVSAQVVNEARNAFFYEQDVLDEIDAFRFVNGDPVSPICQDLAGTVFKKNDSGWRRLEPPLHWNCKSYIVPILKGKLRGRVPVNLRASTNELLKYVQFSEICCCNEHSITFAETNNLKYN